MLARPFASAIKTLPRIVSTTMPIATLRPREDSPGDSPSAKRVKLAEEIFVAKDVSAADSIGKDVSSSTADEMQLPIEYVKTYEHDLDYRDQLVLAPMVRTGSCKLTQM